MLKLTCKASLHHIFIARPLHGLNSRAIQEIEIFVAIKSGRTMIHVVFRAALKHR